MNKHTLIALVLSLCLIGCIAEPAPTPDFTEPETAFDPELIEQIDTHVAQKIESTPLVGLVVAVDDGERPVFVKSYGYADLEAPVETEIPTVYRIGSISKTFTAAAILKLAEEGKLNLDDSVSRYFPNLPGATDEITIRHLLNHTAGLPSNDRLLAQIDIDPYATYTSEDINALIEHVFRTFDPRPTEFAAYSNLDYRLLALIIGQVSGKTYQEYLNDAIFQPLGLNDTSHCVETPDRLATGYRVFGGEPELIEGESMSLLVGSGSLCSTAGDLVRWHRALRHGEIIGTSFYEEMLTPTDSAYGPQYAYGLGLEIYRDGDEIVETGHGGAVFGYTSIIRYYVKESTTVVILTNTTPPMQSMDVLNELSGLIRMRHKQHYGAAQ